MHKMRRKISTIIIAGIMVLASGCQDNGFDFTVTKARIVPVVSSVATTKAAENLPAAPKHIATYTISDDPENPLYLHVLESDIEELPSQEPLTRGSEITTENISEFYIKAFAKDGWKENDIEQTKGEYFPSVKVTKSSGVWTMATEQYWINGRNIRFWSWHGAEPAYYGGGTTTGGETQIKNYHVDPTADVADQKDVIVAYNSTLRKLNEDKTGMTEGDTINIHFRHALSKILFDVTEVAGTVGDITLSNVYSKGDCTITAPSDYPVFDWGLTQNTPVYYTASASDVLFLIPQELKANSGTGTKGAATMSVVINGAVLGPVAIDKNGTEPVEWKAGKYYKYKITKSSILVYSDDWTDGSSEITF